MKKSPYEEEPQGALAASLPLQLKKIMSFSTQQSAVAEPRGQAVKPEEKEESALVENNRCDVCYMEEKNAVLLPCKHNCTCVTCAKNL